MVTYNADLPAAPASARVGEGISRFSKAADLGVSLFRTSPMRMREIERLSRMSDAELGDMGLKRDEIARHVYRDTLSA